MSLFSKKETVSKSRNSRVVVTGKRVKGAWIMESALPLRRKAAKPSGAILGTENRRVRTLH
jgi:hypothetical protein